jgi:predicted nucleic acid-binding protein
VAQTQICVDASVALKLVLDEEDSDKAHALWTLWVIEEIDVIAPCHLAFEVTSVIRNHVYRGEISAEAGQLAFEAIHAQGIKLIHPDTLHERAWELAQQFDRPTAYDAYYLALGEIAGCDVWTADGRLYRAVEDTLQWVRWLDDYIPA